MAKELRTIGWTFFDNCNDFLSVVQKTTVGSNRMWKLGNTKEQDGIKIVQLIIECASCDVEARANLHGMIEFWNVKESIRMNLRSSQIPSTLMGYRKCKNCPQSPEAPMSK